DLSRPPQCTGTHRAAQREDALHPLLPLLPASRLGLVLGPHPELVPLQRPRRSQWPPLAGPTTRPPRGPLPAPRQPDQRRRGRGVGPTAAPGAGARRLAAGAGGTGAPGP